MGRGGHPVYGCTVVSVALGLVCSVSLWKLRCEEQKEEDSVGGGGKTRVIKGKEVKAERERQRPRLPCPESSSFVLQKPMTIFQPMNY